MEVSKSDIKKWVKALRSGKYEQTKSALQDEHGFCCLGVACKVVIPASEIKTWKNGHLIGGFPSRHSQPSAPEWLTQIDRDFAKRTSLALSELNDNGIPMEIHRERLTFDEIADLLEAVYIHKVLS